MTVLHGVRVLDLSRVLAGPYCTGLLADLGADVVKVESPAGDDSRHLGPFRDGESVYFAQLNHGKRSIVLDLKNPADLDVLVRLAARADVVVENFRPGVTARLGIDWAALSARNPDLVYASISGFGQSGPLSRQPAYDLIVQAMSGLMAATGVPDGDATRIGESLGDVCAGMFAAWSICAALFDRERTGRGRHLDISMLDSLVSMQVTSMSILTATGRLPGRIGNRHPVSTPFDTYRTKDGLVAIAVANDTVFARFAALVERPDLAADPDFATDRARSERVAEIKRITEDWTSRHTTAEVLAMAEPAGVPAAPIWGLDEALRSEQIEQRGLVGHFDHPTLGRTPYLRQPVHFGDNDRDVRPSPGLDEHADEVRAEWLGTVEPSNR
ncbi:CoA transferase [Planosporangium thailandense]|uniref:CoA transferase n=1 Tax=Planosporangium thailandense TaxID=765197 RepID=A0ABX0XZ81_9ACTN|nr:CoA transferase [Planosporangium thailandense]NJC71372.1 CoA transferase [Planosporangium thailandense]